jgi:hypothetical protein
MILEYLSPGNLLGLEQRPARDLILRKSAGRGGNETGCRQNAYCEVFHRGGSPEAQNSYCRYQHTEPRARNNLSDIRPLRGSGADLDYRVIRHRVPDFLNRDGERVDIINFGRSYDRFVRLGGQWKIKARIGVYE